MPTNPPATDGRPAPAPTEAAFLQAQADQAAAALTGAFAALKADLAKGADPRAWAHQYPWAAVGAAAVAGFAAASTLVPSKEDQALKKLERIERALRPDLTPGQSAAQRSAAPDSPRKSMTSRLVSELFSALKPALSSALAAYAATPDNDHPHNGHAPTAGPAAAGNAAYYQQEEDPNA